MSLMTLRLLIRVVSTRPTPSASSVRSAPAHLAAHLDVRNSGALIGSGAKFEPLRLLLSLMRLVRPAQYLLTLGRLARPREVDELHHLMSAIIDALRPMEMR